MDTFSATAHISDELTKQLADILIKFRQNLCLDDAVVNYNYPLAVTPDGDHLRTRVLIVSQKHGIILLTPAALIDQSPTSSIEEAIEHAEKITGEVLSKMVKDRATRQFQANVSCAIFAPHLRKDISSFTELKILRSATDVLKFVNELELLDINKEDFSHILAVLETSKSLKQRKHRNITKDDSKGRLAANAELEIATFDRNQVETFLSDITGLERIKGLAGSGKTVVLAVKAAIIHAFYPEKKIAFTYYTKSLHQQITNLISMFHHGITEQEPNWNNMMVMYGWGGKKNRGFYYDVCMEHSVSPIIFSQAKRASHEPFDYICRELLKSTTLQPIYDYVFIDEGQDFPSSFLRLASKVTKEHKLVWAYDALQNIFNVQAPKAEEIFDKKDSIDVDDHALKKCYRNSGEILVTAHALGFGIYGKIVQMLENQEYWEDLGYVLESGELSPGSTVMLNRPAINSLQSISTACRKEELVIAKSFRNVQEEIEYVVDSIRRDIQTDELRADDIMVISVDSRASDTYLDGIAKRLTNLAIKSLNLRTDPSGGMEFSKQGHVTLVSVNRAKGNEAYMVYVVGTDALFEPSPDPISRNSLFTAITRAKGWVRVTGVGDPAANWKTEIDQALSIAPRMKFKYPTKAEWVVMERELQKGRKREKQKEKFERFLDQMTEEEVEAYLAKRRHARKKLQEFTNSVADSLRIQAAQSDSMEFFDE